MKSIMKSTAYFSVKELRQE